MEGLISDGKNETQICRQRSPILNHIFNLPQPFSLDKPFHAWLSHFAGWMSPTALLLAYVDWLSHLSFSPDKQLELIRVWINDYMHFLSYLSETCQSRVCEPCVESRSSDHRFQDGLWTQFPFNIYSQVFLMTEQFWDVATTNLDGVDKHHQNLVNFTMRQMLDIFSPSNFPLTNPEVIWATYQQHGNNFLKGFNNWVEDFRRIIQNRPPVGTEAFKVGENIAITPGKVIYRNHLIELIQYEPQTTTVNPEPILIVPACIMKYYILDLSPNNSMVKYLIDKGHTVFMISWRNPTKDDRDLSMDDYVKLGVLDAAQTIHKIIPKSKVHAVGYCIGGTILMLAAALLAKKNKKIFKSITLFASQVDFKDAGELLLFIDENQVSYLESIMWEKGYLDGAQMAGTFSMLRSVDLIWSKNVHDYQIGNRRPINDLMAWDYDNTRLPYKMHTEYLRKLFLNNDFVEGHYHMDGLNLSLLDITCPIFAVSTIKDHVAPWQSVFKIHYFTEAEITFVLTNGGHNSGVVNEPGHLGRNYHIMTHKTTDKHLSPERWLQKAEQKDGSWWPAWHNWLTAHSGAPLSPPSMGSAQKGYDILCDAPGTYVFQ